MSMPLSAIAVPAIVATVTNMRGWLDKPAVRAAEATLLEARLAPDMFPLVRQFQTVSDTSKGGVARLAGIEAPSMPDTETSFDELQARLDRTLDFVRSVDAAAIDAAAIDAGVAREVVMNFPNGGGMRFDGQTYLTGFVLPNLYFHATTAYAILRANGIEIGKFDFLGHLAPYVFAPPAGA